MSSVDGQSDDPVVFTVAARAIDTVRSSGLENAGWMTSKLEARK